MAILGAILVVLLLLFATVDVSIATAMIIMTDLLLLS